VLHAPANPFVLTLITLIIFDEERIVQFFSPSCYVLQQSGLYRSQFESREFQHPGNSDLDVYRVEEKILKEICFVPVGWAEVPRNKGKLSPLSLTVTAASLLPRILQ